MPIDLDPLSQLIGALSAQGADLGRQLSDLRTEVVTNRSQNQLWRDELRSSLETLHAELRNLKYDARGAEQSHVALDARLTRIDSRLSEIEAVITVWKAKATLMISMALSISTLLGFVITGIINWAK